MSGITPAGRTGSTDTGSTGDAGGTPAPETTGTTPAVTRGSGGLAARAGRIAPPDAKATMEASLDRAAADGLAAKELEAAEAEVAELVGPEKAKEALLAALGIRMDKLSLEAVGWLQGRHGSMDGHVARYQAVLTTHLKDAKILDADFDGKLSENDVIFEPDAAGKVNVRKLDAALRDRLKIGGAIVGSAEALDRAGHSFVDITPTGWSQQFPATHWEGGPYDFRVKAGVKPSDALADLFRNPTAYKFECGTAMAILYNKAILDLIGPKDFDRVAANLRIGPSSSYGTGMTPHYDETGNTWGGGAESEPGATLKAGDRGYFRNWDVSAEGSRLGWSGENVVFLGDGKYYGHPFGIETGEHIVNYLNGHRNAGSTRPASMSPMHGLLGSGILAEDKEPE